MRLLQSAALTIGVVAVAIVLLGYAMVRGGGLSADARPGPIERMVASRLVRLSIPADAAREANPFRGDPDAGREAADHFLGHCAMCHGPDGRGGTDLGEDMYPKAPDLAAREVQQLSDGELFYIIQNGIRWTGMPAFKNEHTAEDTWRLVSLVRKMPSASAKDRVTPPASSNAGSALR